MGASVLSHSAISPPVGRQGGDRHLAYSAYRLPYIPSSSQTCTAGEDIVTAYHPYLLSRTEQTSDMRHKGNDVTHVPGHDGRKVRQNAVAGEH